MKDFSLRQLQYACEVDKHKSFQLAAEECNVSQPTLSMQIKKLEQELDIVIFRRSRKGVETTEAGKSFIQKAKNILNEAGELLDEVQGSSESELRGQLRIGIIPTIAPYLVPLFLKDFTEKFPHVKLYIEEERTSYLMEKLEREELDCGILAPPLNSSSDLLQKKLFSEPFKLFVSANNELQKKKKVSLSDLRANEMYLLSEEHCLREQSLSICKQKKLAPGQVEFSGGSLESIMRLVEVHSGYTIIPALATQYMSPQKQLKMVKEFDNPVPGRNVSLLFNRASRKKKFFEALAQRIIINVPKDILESKQVNEIPLKNF